MTVKNLLWSNATNDVEYTAECLKEVCSSLNACGVLQYLMEMAKPVNINPVISNYAEAHIAEANRCIGVNSVLDILLNFRAIVKNETKKDVTIGAPLFGSNEYLKSVLTDKELAEINKQD